MNNVAGSLLPAGFLTALGLSALGFHYCAVHGFDVGTVREYIPNLKSSPAPAKCVKRR